MDIDDRVMVVSKAIQCINVKFINNPFKVKSFATNAVFNNEILVISILGHVFLELAVCICVF